MCLHVRELILFDFCGQLALNVTKCKTNVQFFHKIEAPAVQRSPRVLSSLDPVAAMRGHCQRSMTTANYCWTVQPLKKPESDGQKGLRDRINY